MTTYVSSTFGSPPPAVADAYCASRLAGDWGRVYGTLPRSVDAQAIIGRALAP